MKEIIHFYHMNDWHSHLENWPKIERYYNYQRRQHIEDNEPVFLFDIGDAYDRQHPLAEATDGQIMIDLLNQIGIDAATIGNNEGIGNPHEVLEHLYDRADFPVVVGNLLEPDSQELPAFAKPYTMLQTEKGIRMAVMGMTAPFDISYKVVNWQPLDPIEEIKHVLGQIKSAEQYDVILLLSHLGLNVDRKIAGLFPDINIIFGAHTHHVLPEGEVIGNTLLTGGGKYGQFIGHVTVDIEVDRALDKVVYFDCEAELIANERMGTYPEDEERVNHWLSEGNRLLQEKSFGYLDHHLFHHENFVNDYQYFTLNAIKWATRADVVILNSGLFLQDLNQGEITAYDLHESIPHPMRIMEVNVSGQSLKRIILEMQNLQMGLVERPIVGMGFRGNVFGSLASEPANLFDGDITAIEDQASYKLMTVDHLLYLPFFKKLQASPHHLWGQPFLREIVGAYISQLNQEDSN